MATPLLILRDIELSFGSAPLLEGAEFQLLPGERLCLVGRNGSGKSTLMKIAGGLIEPDAGEVFLQPATTTRYLPQEPDFTGFDSALAYVVAGLDRAEEKHRGEQLLQRFGLTGREDPTVLSGGEARRAALARVLAPEPDILLLDEPTNHLDLPAIAALEEVLREIKAAMILISHDRRFLETLAQSTLWLRGGAIRRLDKGFAAFEAWRDGLLEQEELDHHKLARKIAREEHWLRYGVTARRKRNQRRLAELQRLRREHAVRKPGAGTLKLDTANSTPADKSAASGRLVIEARDISKAWGDEDPVVRNFSTRVMRGDRVGIVGPNGAGKTTLLNLLTGNIEPDAGIVRIGANVRPATLDQARESLKANWTLAEAITNGVGEHVIIGGNKKHVVGYMRDFLFSPEQSGTPVSALSGGERGRLMLARALALPCNLLVLDEPTNDLDLETLDLLQEMLADYPGTVLLISHDRDFLDRTAASIIAFEGHGSWIEYAGGYSDMLAQRKEPRVDKAKAATPSKGATKQSGQDNKTKARKLSFKDKHALEVLPERIAALTADIESLEARLNMSDFYAKDPLAFERTANELQQKKSERDHAEDRWLELEVRREELER
jgi:ATP-binding cassette subfamily F protein uup